MTDRKQNSDHLESLFAAAKTDPGSAPRPELLARIEEDAAAMQPVQTARPARATGGGPRLWDQFVAAIGGWPSLAGLGGVAAAGVWAGFFASATLLPETMSDQLSLNDDGYLLYLDNADFFEPEDM